MSSDQASHETIAIRNDRNRIPQVTKRIANYDRLHCRFMIGGDWECIWYGPSTEILIEDEH
jgi:hypothetical protein